MCENCSVDCVWGYHHMWMIFISCVCKRIIHGPSLVQGHSWSVKTGNRPSNLPNDLLSDCSNTNNAAAMDVFTAVSSTCRSAQLVFVRVLKFCTDSVVLLQCKKGSCLAEGDAVMALLWIMRQESDPYLKVNVSRCPCCSPSQHCSPLHYRWWPGSTSLPTISIWTSHFTW